jgi:hypothetical protein
MTEAEVIRISGRSKSWLKTHTCAWCDQTLWQVMRHGCASMYEKCEPENKDFSPKGALSSAYGKSDGKS